MNIVLAEWWTGQPIDGFNTFMVEQGNILEGEARPCCEFEIGEEVKIVGLVTDESEGHPATIGCSPDGLIGSDGGVEIKCPGAEKHVAYLRGGTVPKQYLAQIHFSMYVTGRKWWTFMSYRRKFPPFITKVERDERIISIINEAVIGFLERLKLEKEKLIEKNGGIEPKRFILPPGPSPRFTTETASEYARRTGDITP
jgi:hypothetical protein